MTVVATESAAGRFSMTFEQHSQFVMCSSIEKSESVSLTIVAVTSSLIATHCSMHFMLRFPPLFSDGGLI